MKIKISLNHRKRYKQSKELKTLTQRLHVRYARITRLYAFACSKRTLKGKGYSDTAEQYQRTWEDEQRLLWTLHNLKKQIEPLEQQLSILLRDSG